MTNIIITNNPMVQEITAFQPENFVFIDGSYMDVLVAVRDYVHMGNRLITHPLSGSVKPGETPYKTVIITGNAGSLDAESLEIIENSIAAAGKLISKTCRKNWNESILRDFQLIDYSLIFGK